MLNIQKCQHKNGYLHKYANYLYKKASICILKSYHLYIKKMVK